MERVIPPSRSSSTAATPCLNPGHNGKGDSIRVGDAVVGHIGVLILVIMERVIPRRHAGHPRPRHVLILVIMERVIPDLKGS